MRVRTTQMQPAGLLRHAQQGEDVRQAEGVERAFEAHGSSLNRRGGGGGDGRGAGGGGGGGIGVRTGGGARPSHCHWKTQRAGTTASWSLMSGASSSRPARPGP